MANNEPEETESQKEDRKIREYWLGVKAKGDGASPPQASSHALTWQTPPTEPSPPTPEPEVTPYPAAYTDETDALFLIIEALRVNTEAVKEVTAHAIATRKAVEESGQKTKQSTENIASEVRTVTEPMDQMKASKTELAQAKAHQMYWCAGGFAAGIILTAVGILNWQHMFG